MNFTKEVVDLSNVSLSLPQQINEYIYKTYFELKPECDSLIKWIDDNHKLDFTNISEIKKISNKIVHNEVSREYLSNNLEYFDICYKSHYIDNKKNFVLMDKDSSFIASLVMYKWH